MFYSTTRFINLSHCRNMKVTESVGNEICNPQDYNMNESEYK